MQLEDYVGVARRYNCQFNTTSNAVEIQQAGEGIMCELTLGTGRVFRIGGTHGLPPPTLGLLAQMHSYGGL